MKRSAPEKVVASSLALSLLLASPGLSPYEALAQVVTPGMSAGAANAGTGAAGGAVMPTAIGGGPSVQPLSNPMGSPTSVVPQLVPTAQITATPGMSPVAGTLGLAPSSMPGAGKAVVETGLARSGVNAGAARPLGLAQGQPSEADAPHDGAPATTLEVGQRLQTELQAGGEQGAAAEPSGALTKFWSNAKAFVTGGGDVPVEFAGRAAEPSGLRPATPGAAKIAKEGPISPESHPELFAAQSSRTGIGPLKYVYWNTYYRLMQRLNLWFAKDPNNKVSWDKWPTELGLLYLIGKMRFLRSGTITDPYDYATNDVKKGEKEPAAAKTGYTADGRWVSDRERPDMGAANTRDGSNIPPKQTRPDVENLMLKARDIAKKILWRKVDEHGKPIVKPAGILNNLAGGWIQFQFHNFGGNTKRDPIEQNPHRVAARPQDNWPTKEFVVDRTSKDPTRVTDNGRPTIMNERTQAWIQAQIYGTNEEELGRLRSYQDGKMKLDAKGLLPEDPSKPGIDLTGFANNYNPLLSFLHWAFVVNHNNIAEHLRKYAKPPHLRGHKSRLSFGDRRIENTEAEKAAWTDETLFQQARMINVANTNFIHTTEWTEDLLQHPTLQKGMHADAYGLLGPKLKAYLMRMSYRHPWFAKLIKPLSNNDVLWGMPGSKWEHFDGSFQVPKHFRMVYRLHEMILDEQEILAPPTATQGERQIDRVELINFIHNNTRPVVEKYGMDVLAYSFVRKSAGHLLPHNFPRTLTSFKNQQNGTETDLAMLDILREWTDGTGTYNEFRRSVGEAPVTSFLEMTGGDAELAKELSEVYASVDEVHAGIGKLVEPKPAGFALSYTQFYQFVLNAPRRFKSNRHLTEGFTHKDYTFEGMEWVLNSGGMGGVIARAMKGLPHGPAVIKAMEGVTRWFAPWPETETFPVRMLDKAQEHSANILKSNLKTFGLGTLTAVSAYLAVAGTLGTSALLAPAVAVALALPLTLYFKRMLAYRFMEKAWQSAYTDKRHSMFPTLFKGEKWAARAATLGKLAANGVIIAGAAAAWSLFASNPIIALMAGATALSALSTKKHLAEYANDMQILKIALQNRLREGYPVTTDASKVPGETAIQRRYWMLVPQGAEQPVATLWHSYRVLNEHGLGKVHAFKTALMSHLIFGPRTQSGLGIKGRWNAGILFNPFAIYVPNMVQAQGPSSTGIYAHVGNDKGIPAGDVDVEVFNRMFDTWAPGRDYMTAYDFARMREGNRWQAAQEGRGSAVMRFLGKFAVMKRTDQLLQLYADTIANEDKKLVPAISRDMLLRVYQGLAQNDIMKERALDGVHPDLAKPVPLRAE